MCLSLYLSDDSEELREISTRALRSALCMKFIKPGDPILVSGGIRPESVIPVIASNQKGKPSVFPMKWGFPVPKVPPVTAVRAEIVARDPVFREAWQRHRCIIPASWYYDRVHLTGRSGEKALGDRYMLQPAGDTCVWMAGLYRMEDGLPYFTLLLRRGSGNSALVKSRRLRLR